MPNESYERADHDYSGDDTLTHTEIGEIDRKATDAISGTGGTYSLAEPLVIGGDTVNIQSLLDADDAQVDVQSGRKITLNAGATFEAKSGSSVQIKDSLSVDTGAIVNVGTGASIILNGTAAITYAPNRTIVRRGLRLRATTHNAVGGVVSSLTPNPDAWEAYFTNQHAVVARECTSVTNRAFVLEVPSFEELVGCTLSSVQIISYGANANVPTTYPSYDVRRYASINGASLCSGGAVTDAHNAPSTWLIAAATTTITCDQNNVISSSYKYGIVCTLAAHASGAQFYISDVIATYSTPGARD